MIARFVYNCKWMFWGKKPGIALFPPFVFIKGSEEESSAGFKRHENQHVVQCNRYRIFKHWSFWPQAWICYWFMYGWHFIGSIIKNRTFKKAYWLHKFEVEARSYEQHKSILYLRENYPY